MAREPGASGDGASLSVEDAKLQLLGWAVEADEELHAQIQSYVQSARAKTRKVVPLATVGGLLLTMLLGRRKRRRGWSGVRETEERPSTLHTAIRVGMFVLPFVRAMLANRRRY